MTLSSPLNFPLKRMILFQGILLFFLHGNIQAQGIEQVKLPLNSSENYRNGSKINQSVINLLTYGNEKLISTWHTTFEIDYRFEFKDAEPQLNIQALRASGNNSYLDFDLEEALFPDLLEGSFTVAGTSTSAFKAKIAVVPSLVSLGNQFFISTSSISGKIESFTFSEEKLQELQSLIQQINQYWAVNDFANQMLKESASIENKADDEVVALFILREKTRKILLLMKETADFAAIKKSARDPANLWKKLPDYERLMLRLTTLLEAAIERNSNHAAMTHEIASTYRKLNLKTYRKAYQEDFKSHELILKTARLYPDEDFYHIATKISDPELGLNLAGKIAFEWVLLADSLQQSGDFVNSLSLYEDAHNVLETIGQKTAAAETEQRVESTKLGLLRSYLQIAAKAVQAGNDSLSRIYQAKSNLFVNKYPQNNLINRIANESDGLIQTYLDKGNKAYDLKRYPEAINLFEQALSTAKSYYNSHFNEQINQALFRAYRIVFLDLVQAAEQYFQIGELQQARQRLKIATDYQSDHFQFLRTSNEAIYLQNKLDGNVALSSGRLTGESFPQSVIKSHLPTDIETVGSRKNLQITEEEVVQLVKDAQLKVWANEMDEAWRIYEKAAEMAQQSHFDKKKTVSDAFLELDQRMIERICLNNKFRRDDLMQAAHRMIARKDFGQLQANLQQVIDLGAANQGCVLDVQEAETLLEKYQLLFRYQNDYAEVLNRLYGSGIKAAIPMYNFFDQQLEQYQLEKFGVQHQDLKTFVKNQNNSNLTLQAITFFVEQMDAHQLEVYLQILIHQEFDFHNRVDLFQKMGTLLAVADSQKPELSADMRISEMIGNDKRFNEMKKTYLRSMKKLSKINRSSSKIKK